MSARVGVTIGLHFGWLHDVTVVRTAGGRACPEVVSETHAVDSRSVCGLSFQYARSCLRDPSFLPTSARSPWPQLVATSRTGARRDILSSAGTTSPCDSGLDEAELSRRGDVGQRASCRHDCRRDLARLRRRVRRRGSTGFSRFVHPAAHFCGSPPRPLEFALVQELERATQLPSRGGRRPLASSGQQPMMCDVSTCAKDKSNELAFRHKPTIQRVGALC